MAEIVRMPKLSDTMTEGVVAEWHKKIGDVVESGELLAEIETDKATMEFESFQDGVLLHIGCEKGATAPVDSILAILGEKGEDISSLLAEDTKPTPVEETKEETDTEVAKPSKKAIVVAKPNVNAEIVRMPKLSDTMTEGVVAAWHKKVGDSVESGEILAEIETDKATMEFESFQDGTLLYIGCETGASAPVESILAILGEKGADFQALIDYENSIANTSSVEEVETLKTESKPAEVVKTSTPKVVSTKPKAKKVNTSDGRAKVSPLAKKLAEEKGINLAFVNGTGDNGRIVKRDIDNYQGGSVGATFVGSESYRDEPVSRMRKAIAARVSDSKFTAPHFYVTSEINMDAVIEARKTINTVAPAKISFNDFVMKAVASAIRKNPDVNTSWLGDTIRYNDHINIGVAMSIEDGLIIPVVRYADGKTLSQISNDVKDFAVRAQENKLQPEDWEGSTFTVSNLGMFGVEEFTAIVNPPNACILAIGGIKQTPIVKNGQIVPGNVMKVTLTSDHRVVDGAVAAKFLKTLKQLLENPVLLLGEQSI